jgi:23S rRNA pseudouridine1911/1915/1917 synthase
VKETVPPALAGERIDRVVSFLTGLARSEVATLVDSGAVTINGSPARSRSRKVNEGDEVAVEVPVRTVYAPVADPDVEFEVLYADDAVIVVDKPADLVVHPGSGNLSGTLVHGLLARFPDLAQLSAIAPERPGIVHRLDKGTSGLLVVARTAEAYASLVEQLSRRLVERRYRALTWGSVEAESGIIDAPVGRSGGDPTRMAVSRKGKEARTRYQVVRRRLLPEPTTELDCSLETGRTHQIRVHLSAIGHPVVGDARYRGRRPAIEVGRPFLHAAHLAFDHPVTAERVHFDSPLPADLTAVLQTLEVAEDGGS